MALTAALTANRHAHGVLLIALSTVAFSSAGFFTRLIHLDVWTMLFWRGWFAGAMIDWQSQLGYSLGIAQQLLPLGDQINYLETISDRWFLVIPGVGVVMGLLGAFIGLLAGGLWAALVNVGVLPIEVSVLHRGENDAERRAATRRARDDRRRKAVGE